MSDINLKKMSKNELLIKCEELGIVKYKSKNKNELINLILNKSEIKSEIKFIDLFCGIGGFHNGLKEFKCELACDIDKECQKTYYDNYGIKPKGDIFDINPDDISDHQILTAGFNCQPYSQAGDKKGFDDERSKSYNKLIEIINKKQPNIIILENVKNLININDGIIFKTILDDLNEINYNVSYSILNVSNFGLPQNRERVFIIGINRNFQNKYFNFENLNLIKINTSLKDFIDLSNTDYIDEDKYIILDEKYITKQKSGLIFCGYIKGNIRINGALPNTEHLSRVHKQPNRIYHIDGVNPTLSSSEASGRYYIYDNKGVRKLTLNECYKIMGFDDNFIMNSKKSSCYNQIGNSVSPIIIKIIKDELIKQQFIELY
jgi:DNA (cytosine-5)-methyltransferase 1